MLKAHDLVHSGIAMERFGNFEDAKMCYAKAAQAFWRLKRYELSEDCFLKATSILLADRDIEEAYEGLRVFSLMLLGVGNLDLSLRVAEKMVVLKDSYPDFFANAFSFHRYISDRVRSTQYRVYRISSVIIL